MQSYKNNTEKTQYGFVCPYILLSKNFSNPYGLLSKKFLPYAKKEDFLCSTALYGL